MDTCNKLSLYRAAICGRAGTMLTPNDRVCRTSGPVSTGMGDLAMRVGQCVGSVDVAETTSLLTTGRVTEHRRKVGAGSSNIRQTDKAYGCSKFQFSP